MATRNTFSGRIRLCLLIRTGCPTVSSQFGETILAILPHWNLTNGISHRILVTTPRSKQTITRLNPMAEVALVGL